LPIRTAIGDPPSFIKGFLSVHPQPIKPKEEIMATRIFTVGRLAAALIFLFTVNGFAGSLEPLDPPGSTMKTLDQVQPCTPVQSLPGDTDATHVISESGSYYLTGNLTGESGKYGIKVDADNVTIDLKGFGLIGVAGSADGVFFVSGRFAGAVVNGVVRSWGEAGIDAATLTMGRFASIISEGNGGAGILLGDDSVAQNCLVRENNSFGISAAKNCLILNCVARSNQFGGFKLYSRGVVKDCIADDNNFEGVLANFEAQISNCNLAFNGQGIVVGSACHVFKNNCIGNNIGIRCGGTGGNNRIDENNIVMRSTSTAGIQVEQNNLNNFIIRNTVKPNASGSAFDINDSAGTANGPIVNVIGVGDISSMEDASHPWANFIF
jgi:hypothetical protein